MAELRIVIPDRLEAKLQSAMPDYLDRKGFVCLLLDKALDGVDTLGLAKRSEQASPSSSSIEETTSIEVTKTKTRAKPKDPFSGRQLPENAIPDDLLDCQQLLREFWAGKKGGRTGSIFNRVCRKLRTWPPEMRREALERAINSGWGDVYEPAISKATQRVQQPSLTEQARALGMI
jgi:hypothetical protein